MQRNMKVISCYSESFWFSQGFLCCAVIYLVCGDQRMLVSNSTTVVGYVFADIVLFLCSLLPFFNIILLCLFYFGQNNSLFW